MQVHYFCSYVTWEEGSKRDDDWHAMKFVKALKGEPFKGYALIPVGGQRLRLEPSNAERARDWFGRIVADLGLSLDGFDCIIPVPNSDTVDDHSGARTLALCQSLARHVTDCPAVIDALRYRQAVIPAHRGGDRSADYHERWLRVIGSSVESDRCLLVDEVVTTGGHLQACARVLRAAGVRTCAGLVAARTAHSLPARQFDLDAMEIGE